MHNVMELILQGLVLKQREFHVADEFSNYVVEEMCKSFFCRSVRRVIGVNSLQCRELYVVF